MYCSVVLFSLVESFGGSPQTTSEDLGIGLSEDSKNVQTIQKSGKTQVNIFVLHFPFVFLKKKKSDFIMPAHCWTPLFSIQSSCSCYALKSNVHVIYFFYIWIWFINHSVLIFYTFKHFYFKVTVRTRIELWITWSSLTAVQKFKKKAVSALSWFIIDFIQIICNIISYDLFKLANYW